MEVGKISAEILQQSIIHPLQFLRKEVLLRPDVGEDCSAIQLNQDEIFVLTTDPITGASENVGKLAVHICCNDLASSGAEPVGIMVTIMMPPGTTEKTLKDIMSQVSETSKELGIDILGGHTEVTEAVNRVVVSATAVGKVNKDFLVSSKTALPGDDIILTKTAGVEGTAIIATEKEEELKQKVSEDLLKRAQNFIQDISVVKEGLIAAQWGVSAMHDVTEGGVLGALWEIAEASQVGVELYRDEVPVAEETLTLCSYYQIDPLKLISSGSMIITSKNGHFLVEELIKQGIKATVIGKVTEAERYILSAEGRTIIEEPQADELYKVI